MLADWLTAWRNVRRNRRRHLLTGVSIALGSASIVLFGGYILRMRTYLAVDSIYINHKGHITLYHKDGLDKHTATPRRYSLTASEQQSIKHILAADPAVEFTGSYLEGMGLIANGCSTSPVLITGSEIAAERRVRRHPVVLAAVPELTQPKDGTGFWEESQDGTAISITPALAELIGKPVVSASNAEIASTLPDCEASNAADQLATNADIQLVSQTFSGDFGGISGHISGHHSTGIELLEDTSVLAPLPTLQALYETDAVSYIAVYLQPQADLSATLARLRAAFAAAPLAIYGAQLI